MTYHPITQTIISLLKERGCWFETFEHEAVTTSEEAARLRPEYTLHQGTKAIIVRVRNRENLERFVMLVFPGDCKFSNINAKKVLNVRDLCLATVEEVLEVTGGVERGGVPPFGNLFNLEIIADASVFGNEKIIFNAGDRRFSVAMKSADYRATLNPRVEGII